MFLRRVYLSIFKIDSRGETRNSYIQNLKGQFGQNEIILTIYHARIDADIIFLPKFYS